MELTVTDKQWEIYLGKYDGLMRLISKKISGDLMTASFEDNYSDLCIAAIESIKGYHKKTGIPVDEFLETKLFDQYTKSVLWHKKASKGVKLTDKMDFRNAHFSIHPVETEEGLSGYEVPDTSLAASSTLIFDDMFNSEDPLVSKVISAIMADPRVLKTSGRVNTYRLIKPTGLKIEEINKAVKKIESILQKNFKAE